VRDLDCGGRRIHLEFPVRQVECRRCQAVKRELLDWLADNPTSPDASPWPSDVSFAV
jgi:hypothetical protein